VLAGLLLVREAGGWTNDFLAGNPVIACTSETSARLCAAMDAPSQNAGRA
jgi:myo-inositol-1(or 4)-monophosphatase